MTVIEMRNTQRVTENITLRSVSLYRSCENRARAKQICRFVLGFWCLAFCFTCLGCQRATSKIAPVNGVVLLNGMPARASITAQAVTDAGQLNGRPSTSDTLPDGTFSLQYREQQPGVLVGPQRVTISVFPHERAEGEFDFNRRFQPVKVVQLNRTVELGRPNIWKFFLTL